MKYERITIEPGKMGGVPCIRGMRFPVATVVRMIAQGMSVQQIVDEHPALQAEDVREALEFAAEAVGGVELPVLH